MQPSEDIANGRWVLESPERLGVLWPGARFSSLGAGTFGAVVLRRTLAQTRIEGISATPYRCERTPDLVKKFPRDAYALAAVLTGTVEMRRGSSSFTAHEGDVFVHRSGEFSFDCPTPGRTFRTVVGADLIAGGERSNVDLFEVVPASAFTVPFVRFAFEILRVTTSTPLLAREATRLEQALLVLQRAILSDAIDRQVAHVSDKERLLLQALAYIEEHLSDPALTPDEIAKALSVSRRWLFQAFTGQTESIAGTVRRRRLEVAAETIEHFPQVTSTNLAQRTGFRSGDQLGRACSRQYGMSISQYRAARPRSAFDPAAESRRTGDEH